MPARVRRNVNLGNLLKSADTPVFAVDQRRRLVFFNAGCERLTGWKADELLSRVCEYRTTADPKDVASIANALCPPPEVFDGAERRTAVYLPHRDGRTLTRRLVFLPLLDTGGEVTHVLGVVDELEQPTKTNVAPSAAARLHAELASLRLSLRRRYGVESLVGRSLAFRRALEQIRAAALGSAPVLFVGPPGSGRRHAARVVHNTGDRGGRVFVPLECATLTAFELKRTLKRLLEPEEPSGRGLQPGTLFLADVDRLPRDLQEFVADAYAAANGGLVSTLRLTASTSRDPEEGRATGVYRDDFFYLLTSLRVDLLPLVERMDDLEPLAVHFLEATNRGVERQVAGFDERVWSLFRGYHWPGNVAELRRVVEDARENATGTTITPDDLPFGFRAGLDARTVGPRKAVKPEPLDPLLQAVETEQIRSALQHARFNKSEAAKLLDITRARLYRRMKELGLDDFGPGDVDAAPEETRP